jgi:hypothetical protein
MVSASIDKFTKQASNKKALALYAKLGFSKEERLARYYLNGGDAFRLKLWVDVGNNHSTASTVKSEEKVENISSTINDNLNNVHDKSNDSENFIENKIFVDSTIL